MDFQGLLIDKWKKKPHDEYENCYHCSRNEVLQLLDTKPHCAKLDRFPVLHWLSRPLISRGIPVRPLDIIEWTFLILVQTNKNGAYGDVWSIKRAKEKHNGLYCVRPLTKTYLIQEYGRGSFKKMKSTNLRKVKMMVQLGLI